MPTMNIYDEDTIDMLDILLHATLFSSASAVTPPDMPMPPSQTAPLPLLDINVPLCTSPYNEWIIPDSMEEWILSNNTNPLGGYVTPRNVVVKIL